MFHTLSCYMADSNIWCAFEKSLWPYSFKWPFSDFMTLIHSCIAFTLTLWFGLKCGNPLSIIQSEGLLISSSHFLMVLTWKKHLHLANLQTIILKLRKIGPKLALLKIFLWGMWRHERIIYHLWRLTYKPMNQLTWIQLWNEVNE